MFLWGSSTKEITLLFKPLSKQSPALSKHTRWRGTRHGGCLVRRERLDRRVRGVCAGPVRLSIRGVAWADSGMQTRLFVLACWLVAQSLALVPADMRQRHAGTVADRSPGLERSRTGFARSIDAARLRAHVGEGLRNGLASGLASATCKTLLHPFDVIKTVEQASRAKIGTLQAMKQVAAESGTLSLFTRGLDVTLIGSVPSIAVYFGVYQFLKQVLSLRMGPAWKHTAIALSAALANSIAAVFRVPAELVKQRVQAGLHENALAAVVSIHREAGLLGFLELRSVVAQMMRDIPYAVIMLVLYEGLKTVVASQGRLRQGVAKYNEPNSATVTHAGGRHRSDADDRKGGREDGQPRKEGTLSSSTMQGFVGMGIGAISGAMGALLTCPLDVVKVSPDPQKHLVPPEAAGSHHSRITRSLRMSMPPLFVSERDRCKVIESFSNIESLSAVHLDPPPAPSLCPPHVFPATHAHALARALCCARRRGGWWMRRATRAWAT